MINWTDILTYLDNNCKIRGMHWEKGQYIHKKGSDILTQDGGLFGFTLSDISRINWEVVNESVSRETTLEWQLLLSPTIPLSETPVLLRNTDKTGYLVCETPEELLEFQNRGYSVDDTVEWTKLT